MTKRSYPIVAEISDTLRTQLLDGLKVFNEAVAGPYNDEPLSLAIRDEEQVLLGGLSGLFYWNMLHVHLLWIHADYRRCGYGTALLTRAEEIAVERRCEVIYLDTYTFQAPGFYAKRGYTPFGRLNGAPRGFDTTWFAKRLVAKP